MNKFIYDTMTYRGIWSQKRVLIYASIFFAVTYAFLPLVRPDFDVKEFVFFGFLGIGGFTIFRNQKKNENEPSPDTYTETTVTETNLNIKKDEQNN